MVSQDSGYRVSNDNEETDWLADIGGAQRILEAEFWMWYLDSFIDKVN